MKYNKWISIGACVLLMVACYLPWTYHADVDKNFTGFFSQNDAYGRPGRYFIFLATLCLLLILRQKIWSQRFLLFVAGVMVAYAIKTYILYTSCYNAYCPVKLPGIYLMLALNILIFLLGLFPDIKIAVQQKKGQEAVPETHNE